MGPFMALELRSYHLRQSRMGFLPQRSNKRGQSSPNMAIENTQKDTAKTICLDVLKEIQ